MCFDHLFDGSLKLGINLCGCLTLQINAHGGMIGDLNADGGNTWSYGGLALCMTGFGDFIFQAMFATTGATIISGA